MKASRAVCAAWLACAASALAGDLVGDVRDAVDARDFSAGERLISGDRRLRGTTPEGTLALSWMARGALAAKRYDQAARYAAETRALALEQLRKRSLDAEKRLPLALGASIEVQAQVMAARGERGEAVAFLRKELEAYAPTSIAARIQKNINLLSLEGKPAPALEMSHFLGARPRPLAERKGHPVLLFFWAHWCGDCKAEVAILAKLIGVYGPRGLTLIGPTQHYGYAAGGEDASPEQETRYIDQVRKQFYGALGNMPAPLSETNFRTYGCSTTPTLVLVDGAGIVRMYHPGAMDYDALARRVEAVLGPR